MSVEGPGSAARQFICEQADAAANTVRHATAKTAAIAAMAIMLSLDVTAGALQSQESRCM